MSAAEIEKPIEKIMPIQPSLVLISRGLALRYNIPAEYPVFVSPNIAGDRTVSHPSLQFFQVGLIVEFSSRPQGDVRIDFEDGSTYFGSPVFPEYIQLMRNKGGLPFIGIATLVPVNGNPDNFFVSDISVYCRPFCCVQIPYSRKKLNEGIIVSSQSDPDILIPLCGSPKSIKEGESPQFNFRAVDGEGVVFNTA